jgi:hypothetical protein
MARKRKKPIAKRPVTEQRPLSPEMQARMAHFVKAMGHLILMKVNPAAALDLAHKD